jgi:hypothetical protein
MVLRPRAMPTFQFQRLNPAFQSDPRRILGQQLMGQGASTAPVRTPLQGLGRLSSALVGAYLQRNALDAQAQREAQATEALQAALPQNLTPGMAALFAANPAAAEQAVMTAAIQPTTQSRIVDQNGLKAIETTTTNPVTQRQTTTLSNLVQPRPATKPDVFNFVNPDDPSDVRSILSTDPNFQSKAQSLVAQGFVERQGGGTSVSVNPTIAMGQEQESEFRKAAAASASKRIEELGKQVTADSDLTTRLNIADKLLEGGTETGPMVNLTLPIRKLARDIGFLSDEQSRDLSNQQILTAAFNYIIPRMRVAGSGATSDFEARLFSSATANMGNSPEANKALVKSMQALVERREKLLQAMEEYADENNSLIGFAKFADENVPPAFKAYSNDADFDDAVDSGELKPGDLYFNGITATFEIYEEQ